MRQKLNSTFFVEAKQRTKTAWVAAALNVYANDAVVGG